MSNKNRRAFKPGDIVVCIDMSGLSPNETYSSPIRLHSVHKVLSRRDEQGTYTVCFTDEETKFGGWLPYRFILVESITDLEIELM